jgi:hypothetical protein
VPLHSSRRQGERTAAHDRLLPTSDDRSPITVEVVRTSHSAIQVRRVWLRTFLTGLALWVTAVVVVPATGNADLIPA